MARRKARRDKESRIRGTAPSSPDIRKLKPMGPHPEGHHPSEVDAMGQDKRRQIVGHAYGPSKRSQALFFVAVGAIILLVVGGSLAAVSAFDQPADEYPDEAPWSEASAPQIPPNDPSGPCGEPGNSYPFPKDSACARATNSENETGAGGQTLGSQGGP